MMAADSNRARTVGLGILTRRRALTIGGLMVGTALLTEAARPRRLLAAKGAKVDLERLIPSAFGDWQIDRSIIPVQPAPDLLEKVEAIYDETLARTYVNSRGQRVMLSIAYGGDQTGRLRVHRPESCYSAQGFAVKKLREELVSYGSRKVPLNRLSSKMGGRWEPITYWIRVGEKTVTGNIGQRIAQMRYGLNGEIPDGLIFRVSSIERETENAFIVHDEFISALIKSLDKAGVDRLIGTDAVLS